MLLGFVLCGLGTRHQHPQASECITATSRGIANKDEAFFAQQKNYLTAAQRSSCHDDDAFHRYDAAGGCQCQRPAPKAAGAAGRIGKSQPAAEKKHRATKRTRSRSKHNWSSKNHCCSSQIGTLTEQIGGLDNDIVNKQDEINQKQQEVDQKQAEYDQRWADFKDRMRAMQRLNDGGSIALLSSATNLYQLLPLPPRWSRLSARTRRFASSLGTSIPSWNSSAPNWSRPRRIWKQKSRL